MELTKTGIQNTGRFVILKYKFLGENLMDYVCMILSFNIVILLRLTLKIDRNYEKH